MQKRIATVETLHKIYSPFERCGQFRPVMPA